MIEQRINYLQVMHDDLDKDIQKQYESYGDDILIKYLKKKKLQLKDEIEQLKKEINE